MFWELVDVFWRGYRLRCPCCGHGRLFKSFATMHECCAACDERFEREPGQWFGAVYVNLGLTLGLAAIGYLGLQTFTFITPDEQLALWTPITATGPFLFYRLSKGLWTSVVFLETNPAIPPPFQFVRYMAGDAPWNFHPPGLELC